MGTAGYIPPEQIVGERADTRSDVFAVGAVIYEMITGLRAFTGATKTETIRAILSADPPTSPPPASGRLGEIAMKCLQKVPAARYADGSELAADLRRLVIGVEDTSVTELLPETTTSAQALIASQAGTKKWLRWAGAALVLLGLGAGSLWMWKKPKPGVDQTNVALPAAPGELYAKARAYLQRYDRKGNVDLAVDALQKILAENPKHAGALAALAEAYVRRSVQSPDPQWLNLARDAARQAIEVNPDLGAAHTAVGMVLSRSNKPAEAAAKLEEAIRLDPLSVTAHVWLARSRSAEGNKAEAEKAFRRATEINPKDWTSWGELASFLYSAGRYDDAVANCQHALASAPDNFMVLKILGASHHAMNRYADAAAAFQRALEIEPSASIWANLGTARFFQGQYLDSVTAMEKAVELNPNSYLYWGNLADAYRWTPGGAAKAGPHYARAIQLANDRLTAAPADAAARSSLAVYLAKSGDKAAALREAVKVSAVPSKTATVHYKLALAYEIGGDRNKALAALSAAIQAGYSKHEIAADPELASLRSDLRYHRLVLAAGLQKPQ
jgi:serine/threonine-protein kinase